MSKWTQFYDMHSGGDLKEAWARIYIEAPEAKAAAYFEKRFGHNPYHETCDCCGQDYSTSEYNSLEEATRYDREDTFSVTKGRPPVPLSVYRKGNDVLIVEASEIK